MNFIDKMVERFIKLNRRMKRWQRVVSVMAAVVVFATTYALILPAITLDTDTATTQAGIEVAASENEPDEAGTVFESEEEEEPAAEDNVQEEVSEEAVAEENSGSESGSQGAEATQSEVVDDNDADEGEQTEVLSAEEAATYSTTEAAIAAVTGKTAEEIKLITEDTKLVFNDPDDEYVVTAEFGESAKLPEGVQLRVKEITKESDPEAYEAYYQKALSEMQDKYDENTKLSFAKFYDIAFIYEGTEIEPSGNVNVRIEYKQAVEIEKTTTVDTIHFDKNDEEKAEVISSDTKGSEKEVEAVEFESDRFSVYGIVGTELVKEITLTTPDGEDVTYVVSVTYGPDAQIPEGSTLKVTEYDDKTQEYDDVKALVIDPKTGRTADEDGGWFQPQLLGDEYSVVPVEDKAGLAVLDISIIGPNGNEIEPQAAVQVSIVMKSLPEDVEKETLETSMSLKHLVEDDSNNTVIEEVANVWGSQAGELTVSENTAEANFETESFSLFTFTWEGHTANITVHYVDEQGNELLGPQTSNVTITGNSPSQTFAGSNYTAQVELEDQEGGISTYDFKEARLGTIKGDVVTRFSGTRSGYNNNYTYTVTFRNGNTEVDSFTAPFNAELYFIYRPTDYPSGGDDDETLEKPTTEKKLEAAGDGTYTISLSVKGTAKSNTDNTKANVVVIYDTSNSMGENTTARYTGYRATNGNFGRYGLVDGEYEQLYFYFGGGYGYSAGYYEITNGTQNFATVYYNTGGNNYTQYTGTRYNYYNNQTLTRHQVATDAVEELADALLSNNTTTNPDMVEMAFIDFATLVNSVNGAAFTLNGSNLTVGAEPTTDKDTFLSWLHGTTILGNNNVLGGTNWEEALEVANLINFGDSDPTYVIFVSDGNPTFRVSRNGSGQGTNRTSNGRTRATYGSGGGDDGGYNLDAAVQVAATIIQANKHLYSVGAFGDATNMQRIAGAYYDASDPEALTNAFADIVSSITRALNIADVTITDGLTDMTASTFVSGDIGNFIYYKNDEVWTTEEMAAAGAAEAEVVTGEDGSKSVKWAMGENYKLEAGVEYRVEFTVWPKQEAYDLLAALNNGILNWGDDFTYTKADGTTATIPYSEYKDQILKDGNTYSVLTNTEAGITYAIVSEKDGVEIGRETGSDTIDNPTNGMGLDESHLDVRKDWNDTLDPQQLLNLLDSEPDYKVVLHIRNDNNEYVPVTITPVVTRDEDGKAISATWPTEKVYIAPGVMLSVAKATAKGINTDNYKKVTYNGTTYVILESGHDYSIDEHNTDYHFELRAETYHPMVVDGTVCNVSFTYDDDGAIDGITAIDTTNTGTIVATNELRAGINLRKIVVDSEGEEIYPENEYFYLQVSLKDKDGNSIRFADYQDPEKDAPLHDSPYITDAGEESTVSVGWNTYPIWYNIYYDAYDDLDIVGTYIPEGSEYYQRSDGMVVQDGGLIRIKAGDVIRFANVPIGTQFSLKEVNVPAGYGFGEYQYKVGKASTEWTTVTDINTGYGASAAANQSYYFTFKNEQLTSDMLIIKTDDHGNAITSTTDTAIFTLTRNTKSDGKGTWVNATATSGVAADGTITINTTDGINLVELKDGLYKLQENKSPDGYIISSSPVYFKLNGGSIQFVSVEGSGSSAVVTEIDTPEGYTIVEKTDETPVTLKVANTPGHALPNTGGSGTLSYTLGGIALIMASALMYGFRMRRRERRLN